ncbi:MAG: peptide chain release factor-like protein [Planctomycetaceae bacterium]
MQLSDEALLAQCEVRRTRRSGPGGQHRNKVETCIQLVHQPTGIVAEAGERRSQAQNHLVAVKRLRINLALQVRQPAEEHPSDDWLSRCRNGRLSISVDHELFPRLLAEALDMLLAEDWNLATAAERLNISSSQLTRFLKQEPTALTQLNRVRIQRGLHRLA